MKPPETKCCEWCGVEFGPRTFSSGRVEDLSMFKRRRFCSRRCAGMRKPAESKMCNVCREVLPAKAFSRKANGHLRAWCQACERDAARKRYLDNPDAVRGSKAASERKRRADPVIGPKLREKQRHFHRFRGSTAEDRFYAAVLKLDPCSYCGSPAGEIDHIHPSTMGGSDDWSNLTSACRSCNASKGNRPMFPWIGRRVMEYEGQTNPVRW